MRILCLAQASSIQAAAKRWRGESKKLRHSARAEFVAFLDDDLMLPDKSRSKSICCNGAMQMCAAVTLLEQFVTDGVLSPVKRERLIKGTIRQDEYFIAKDAAYTSMLLIRCTALIAVHGFSNTRKYQDKILMLKLYIKGFAIVAVDETLMVMTSHTGERITSKRTGLQSELTKCRDYGLAAQSVSADAVYDIGILTASI